MHWILAVTQGSRERWALENIKRQGHEGYLPLCETETISRGVLVRKQVPLFPRYVFVLVKQQWWYLKGTFGVIGIVMDGELPARVPDKIVNAIRDKERDGLIKLPPRPANSFNPGDRVKIDSGYGVNPFDGFSGVYEDMSGTERAQVLLDIMGRQVPVTVDLRDLKTA